MMTKFFIDTNVFLDLLLSRGEFGTHSKSLFIKANEQKLQLFTSISCIQTVIYILERRKIPKSKIIEAIDYLNQLVTTLAPTTTKDVTKALESDFADLEDAILYFTAIANGCEAFITQNTKDFPKSNEKMAVITPQASISGQSND